MVTTPGPIIVRLRRPSSDVAVESFAFKVPELRPTVRDDCVSFDVRVKASRAGVLWWINPADDEDKYVGHKVAGWYTSLYAEGSTALDSTTRFCQPPGEYILHENSNNWGSDSSIVVTCGSSSTLLDLVGESGTGLRQHSFSLNKSICVTYDVLITANQPILGLNDTWKQDEMDLKRSIDATGIFRATIGRESTPTDAYDAVVVASSADSSFAIELAYNPIGILILSADSLQTMGMATDAVQQTQWSSIEVTGVSHPILANSRVVPSVLSFDGGIPGTHTSFTNTTSAEWIVASEADGRPIVYSVDQCRIVLAGKRVAFGFDTKDWKYVPVDMEHIMRSSLLWLLDSSNENCTETVTPLETLNVTYNPDDATATTVILSWSWDVSSSGIDCTLDQTRIR